MLDLVIHHAQTPDRVCDIGIAEGVIVELKDTITEPAHEIIDATGLLVWPGIIDAHVHFNEPGREDWEGLATGSRALAAGGGTVFFDMPLNSTPPTANVAALEAKRMLAEKKSILDFALWGALLPGNEADMEPLAAAGVIGFKAFMSDSGMNDFPSVDATALRAGMKRAAAVNLPVTLHAEDCEMTRRLSQECQAAGRTGVRDYLASRPVQAELKAIALATELAGETGCRIHIVHVSSPEGIALITSARAAGVDVSSETCPHYLLFNEEDVERIGALAKCAPPIRDESRRIGLWRALAAGDIHTIGSDHSPSPGSMKKSANFFEIWGGIAGCQHGFVLMIDQAMRKHGISSSSLSSVLSTQVAQRFGLEKKGRIAEGQDADLCFLRQGVQDSVKTENLLTRHKISAYIGAISGVRVERTLRRGITVWPSDGNMLRTPARWLKPLLGNSERLP